MQTYTIHGMTFNVPANMNRPRKGQGSRSWGNESGSRAGRNIRQHLRDVATLLNLWISEPSGVLACAGCGAACAIDLDASVTSVGDMTVCLAVVQADRVLTEGDGSAPYAPGLLVPVCPRCNQSGGMTRDAVRGRLWAMAQRVAEHYAL